MVFDFPLSACDVSFSLVTCFSGIKRENEREKDLGRKGRRGLWETFACATGRRKMAQTAITKTETYIVTIIITKI